MIMVRRRRYRLCRWRDQKNKPSHLETLRLSHERLHTVPQDDRPTCGKLTLLPPIPRTTFPVPPSLAPLTRSHKIKWCASLREEDFATREQGLWWEYGLRSHSPGFRQQPASRATSIAPQKLYSASRTPIAAHAWTPSKPAGLLSTPTSPSAPSSSRTVISKFWFAIVAAGGRRGKDVGLLASRASTAHVCLTFCSLLSFSCAQFVARRHSCR